MSWLVVDTSVVIKWLNKDNEQDLDQADLILQDAEVGKVMLMAPELLKYETGNVLLKGKQLTMKQAKVCLEALYSLPIIYSSETSTSAQKTFLLAESLGITYYDAAFIVLAKQYDAQLVTDNVKHQGKATNTKVTALKDYAK
ncbi:MAG: type II toxin-antitoxin system VapC family toxin [Patescibacteria group bacterium]